MKHGDGARELVDLVQADPTFDQLGEQVLAVLDRAVGFDTGILLRRHDEPRLLSRHLDNEQLHYAHLCGEQADTRYAEDLEPMLSLVLAKGGCLTEEAYSMRELRRTRLHDEILRPSGVRSAIHLCARWRGQPLLQFTLSRHGPQHFRAKHLERALALLPTIELCHVSILRRPSTDPKPGEHLSSRELEIALHISRGLSNPQIASLLLTSPHTIRNQVVRIFDKLNVASRSELAALMARAPQPPLPSSPQAKQQ